MTLQQKRGAELFLEKQHVSIVTTVHHSTIKDLQQLELRIYSKADTKYSGQMLMMPETKVEVALRFAMKIYISSKYLNYII